MAEDADNQAERSKVRPSFRLSGVLTLSIGHAVHDTYSAFLPPLLPAIINALAISRAQAGLLAVFIQGPSIFQPLIGHIADRTRLKLIVILCPAVTAAAMSLLGIAPSYPALAGLLLVAGLSSASLHAIGPVVAGQFSGSHLGRGMGLWMVGGELGRTLGPLVIVSAVGYLTLSGTPWLLIGGVIASLALWFRLRDLSAHRMPGPAPRPWRRALRAMGPLLVPLSGIILARAFLMAAVTTYLPLFLSEEGRSLWLAGAALSILEAAGVAGAILGGTASDRFGRRRILAVSLGATPLFMGLFLFAGLPLRIPLLILMGISGLAVTPVILAMVQESFPENRALANGVYMALSFGLRSGVIVLVGALADAWGMR
ncbi:MAG: MFS transporter, partial [Candidatus Eisenbacteria bacterium]|nr:MFS transporter [Candidatus Eisenbacteria bacterium]